jgi:hypothetical protein
MQEWNGQTSLYPVGACAGGRRKALAEDGLFSRNGDPFPKIIARLGILRRQSGAGQVQIDPRLLQIGMADQPRNGL